MILGLNYTANASPSFVRGVVGVKYDDGLTEEFILMATSLTTTRATFVIYPGTQQTLAPTQTFFKPGYVEYAQVVQGGATKIAQRGQLYCALVIADLASFESHTLCADYLFTGNSLTLGVVVPPGPAGGHGQQLNSALTAPAAGADYAAYSAPTGSIQRIKAFYGQLVTSATGANREFSIQYFSSTIRGGFVAGEIQTAALTVDYVGGDGGVSSSGVIGSSRAISSPPCRRPRGRASGSASGA